jgi:RNA ligase
MGNRVSHPFRKFFNIEENRHEPTENFEIYEKVDGSLITVFNYGGEWVISSRGSFTSEQAVAATKLFNEFNVDMLDEDVTYLFELIAPWNRIVCDYGEREELILLGVKSKTYECNYEELTQVSKYLGCNLIRKFDFKDYTEIQKLNWENHEGFIVKFSNGERCKIKFADYVKLHRVLTSCSSYDVWENLMTFGKLPEEMLKDVPDEFYEWVRATEKRINEDFHRTYVYHLAMVSSIMRDGMLTQKELAERFLALTNINHGILFGIASGKDVSEKIWKLIKPAYEKPFNEIITKKFSSVNLFVYIYTVIKTQHHAS